MKLIVAVGLILLLTSCSTRCEITQDKDGCHLKQVWTCCGVDYSNKDF